MPEYRLKKLKPDALQQVLWLHQEAFTHTEEDPLPCVPCKGGCCVSCASAEGYLQYSTSRAELDALKKQYNFDKKKGFLTPTGCALPVEDRSTICVGFICDGYVSEWFNKKKDEVPFNVRQLGHAFAIREIIWNKDNYLQPQS